MPKESEDKTPETKPATEHLNLTQEVESKGGDSEGSNALFSPKQIPSFEADIYDSTGAFVTKRIYKFKPLSFGDAFRALRILSASSAGMAALSATGALQGANIGWGLIASIPRAENHVKDFLAHVLEYFDIDDRGRPGVSTKITPNVDFDNPLIFPFEILYDVLEGFGKHPQIEEFIKKVQGLTKMPVFTELQNRMKTETEHTEGQTTEPDETL